MYRPSQAPACLNSIRLRGSPCRAAPARCSHRAANRCFSNLVYAWASRPNLGKGEHGSRIEHTTAESSGEGKGEAKDGGRGRRSQQRS